jgi:hypothetical protein
MTQASAGLQMLRSLCCWEIFFSGILAASGCVVLASCRSVALPPEPSIEFTRVPALGEGSPDKLDPIEGRVTGALPGQRIVLFALSGMWWVQPLSTEPYTSIQKDSTWRSFSHPGISYAALLVDDRYFPPATAASLPAKGGHVLAVATAKSSPRALPPKTLQFSGYQWEAREAANNPGGSRNAYDASNSWVDEQGLLHLRIAKQRDHWTSAEIKLSRSLGYGRYQFTVRDISHLEPSVVLAFFTLDDAGAAHEMDIEISRWGEPVDKNAQYVIQPYVVPANSVRFEAPRGTLTHWIDWQPGRVTFGTVRGSSPQTKLATVAEHAFTSGVPAPASERVHLHLYVYDNNRNPLQHGTEVIIEKFDFLP